jgi:hypothetical protein
MNERRKLEEKVRAAFADVPYPGDKNIASAGAWEPAAIAVVLRGKDWRGLKGVDFDYGSAPSFLTPEAFHYYLPALLLNLLEDTGSPTYFDSLAGSTVFSLEPQDWDAGFLAERLALLSREQRVAVWDVLRFDAARHPEGLEEDRARIEELADDTVRQELLEAWRDRADEQAEMLAFWERTVEEVGGQASPA